MAEQPGNFNEENARKALESAEKLLSQQRKVNEATQDLNAIWNTISSSVFKISGAEWFSKIPKTNEDLAKEVQILQSIKDQMARVRQEVSRGVENYDLLKDASQKVLSQFSSFKLSSDVEKSLSGEGIDVKSMQSFLDAVRGTGLSMQELAKDQELFKKHNLQSFVAWEKFQDKNKDFIDSEKKYKEYLKKFDKDSLKKALAHEGILEGINKIEDDNHKMLILQAVMQDDLNGYIEKYGEQAMKNLRTAQLLSKEATNASLQHDSLNKQLEDQKRKYADINKQVLDINKGLKAASKQFLKSAVDKLFEFDSLISDAQKNTSVLFKDNTTQMALLTSKTAEFGMGLKDTTEFMGVMGQELRTTNFSVLAGAAEDLKAVQLATGISAENMGIISGELMRAGKSSKDVAKFMDVANKNAKTFGVNSKKVLGDIAKSMDKMRQMGFKGGEESLAKMAARAERLGQNIDEIFNMAKKARSIEGAMEMASELQLAAGSFSNLNPMDLLAAARKGPEELQKILGQMGSDIGKFNDKTGKFEFDPVDVDRLQIVADATGMSIDSLQKQIQKQAEDNKKLQLFPESMFSGIEGVDADDMRAQFADMLNIGENGKIEIAPNSELANFAKEQGISDYTQMTQKQIKEFSDYRQKNQKTLEEQARQNQSFNQSLTSLKDSLMNLLMMLEPAIIGLTSIVQSITKVFQSLPDGLKTVMSFAIAGLAGVSLMFVTGFGGIATKLLGGMKNLFMTGLSKLTGGSMGGGKSPLTTAGAVSDKAGGAGGGPGSWLSSLSSGLQSFTPSTVKGAAMFAASMAIIAGSMALITMIIASVGGEGIFKQMMMLGVALLELGLSMALVSYAAKGIDKKGLLTLSLAMGIVGLALVPFAFAAQMLNDIDLISVLASLGILALVIGGLALLGALMAGPQLLALAVGVGILIGVSAGLLVFASSMLLASIAFDQLSKINWTGFAAMGPALMAVVPGLLGFSLAALAFANPITIFSLVAMTATLGGLAMVMGQLAENFGTSSEDMDRFAMGLEKIQAATDKLDLGKLEQLKEISDSFASASALDNISSAISGALGKLTGGNDKKSGSVKKELTIKLNMNGRDVQKVIIDDTNLLS